MAILIKFLLVLFLTMLTMSQVWGSMLHGPFAESNRAIIALEEDCPNALCYALEIIYSRFGEENIVEKKIATEYAYEELDQKFASKVPAYDGEWQELEEASMTDELEALVDKYELVVVRNYQEEVERKGEVIHLRTKVKTLEKAALHEAKEKASALGMMSTMSLQLGNAENVIWRMTSQEAQNMRQTQGICESFNHSTTRMYEENMRLRDEIFRLRREVLRARNMNCLAADELMGQG